MSSLIKIRPVSFNNSSADKPQDIDQTAIGIDLGTTNSLACISQDGISKIIVDITPSVVAFSKDGQICIGHEATQKHNHTDWTTISSIKSHMGTNYTFTHNNTKYTPQDISAIILKYIKSQAESTLKKPINKAIITVPAYFDDNQRNATKLAAQQAGLEILRLINEPTAAAYAYNIEDNKEGIYAIFDFGGGTFDVSILKMQMGVCQVIATKGDTKLGGDDIDNLIAKHFNISTSLAKEIKEQLSHNNSYTFNTSHTSITLTRDEFDNLILPIIHRCINLFSSTLKDAKIQPNELEGVVLVGGSTRIPLITEAIQHEFTNKIFNNADPDRIVAMGAAKQAENITHRKKGDLLLDVTPLSLGIEVMGGIVQKIIERNTAIPITKAQEFTTFEDGQTGIIIHVLQGEREMVQDCRSIAKFELQNIPPMKAGLAKITIQFNLDEDGILTIDATEKTTNTKQTITIRPTYGLDTQYIRNNIISSIEHGQVDMQKRLLAEQITESNLAINSIQHGLNSDKDILQPHELQNIENILSNYRQSLQDMTHFENIADFNTLTTMRKTLSQYMQNLEVAANDFVNRRIQKQINNTLAGENISKFIK